MDTRKSFHRAGFVVATGLALTLAACGGSAPPAADADAASEAAAIADIQKRVSSFLNARVELKHTPKKGHIVIEYQGNDDLQRILEKLGIES